MISMQATEIVNGMNKSNLRLFRIYRLFNRYNVTIPFEKMVNIFIGENGLGKTTILNCLYYVLSRQFTKLMDIQFERIDIALADGAQYSISKSDIVKYTSTDRRRRMNRGYYGFISDYIEEISEHMELSDEHIERLARQISITEEIPYNRSYRMLMTYMEMNHSLDEVDRKKGNAENVKKMASVIKETFAERIIYLPTYRRIENDISSFNIRPDEISKSELLIRFGMSDVQKSIDDILGEIKNLAMLGYNEMAGLLLQQYTEGESSLVENASALNKSVVKIVLDRLGDKIEQNYKERIFDIVETDSIYKAEYSHLRNLLNKLISNYDLQKTYDTRINCFVDTCNKYLNDKKIVYDPSNLTLEIFIDNGMFDKKIQLMQLSSGEKQIVSLFSKLYLESTEKSIVIIDEPELSLSISWQQMLLPDVYRSQNCNCLLTVTHSPFIFDNEFDMDAKEIFACMSEV